MILLKPNQARFLEKVEDKILQSLSWDKEASWSDQPALAAAAQHLCMASGAKRARPKLCYYFGLSVETDFDRLVDVAVTGEFIHGASLLHDDVIDSGTLRRGRPTVNVKWDNITAVLAGDLLLAESIKGLHRCPRSIAQEALEVVADMTRATMLESHIRSSTDVPQQQWIYIAEGKTASMFRWCGRSTAELANDADAKERFGQFGTNFGIAFQMADDLLDLQESASGKTPFADIRNRNPSFPIILAQDKSPAFRKMLNKYWKQPTLSEEEIYFIGRAAIETGAAEQTRRIIEEYIDTALESLGPYIQKKGCREIALWARGICKQLPQSEAV
ncbi:MAG: polyprenyl synthetase family protein [Myxococcota bacterium]|nr:polyprenyl synthetase family protein [Myxococcota bacterium]